MRASSFSGYVKELIAEKMEISIPVESNNSPITFEPIQMIESKKSDPIRIIETVEKKDTGNFLLQNFKQFKYDNQNYMVQFNVDEYNSKLIETVQKHSM